MTVLVWDKVDEKGYEQGVDHGVLYDENHTNGVVWNGLTSVEEARPDAEVQSTYFDGVKQLDVVTGSDLQLRLSALTIPIEFAPCLGDYPFIEGFYVTGQARRQFGLVYRTRFDTEDYKLHLIYNATVEPSSKSYSTLGETVEPMEHTWNVSTRPFLTADYRPTAHLIVDSRKVTRESLDVLEEILFGFGDVLLIDGGPILSQREVLDAGFPADNPFAEPIDGGVPTTKGYSTPTLISPQEVRSILEEA